MKKFDYEGLLLCEYQGKLFKKSYDLECSSAIFMRRFLHSDLLKKLDENNTSLLSLDVNEGIKSISEQFGESEYGKIKFQMNYLYFTYHTQGPEWCIQNLLELNGLTEDIFDRNYHLKEIMRKKWLSLTCLYF